MNTKINRAVTRGFRAGSIPCRIRAGFAPDNILGGSESRTQVLALGAGGRWALAADGLETLDIEGLQAR